MAEATQDNFESSLGSSVPGPMAALGPAPHQPATPEGPDEDTAHALDSMADVFNKASLGQPSAPPPTPLVPKTTEIPLPPAPMPGVYSPDQEQAALRAANSIADPERRMRVQQYLKQEYANDAMMDGITAKIREENKITASSAYYGAADQLMNDEHVDWATKQTVLKKLVDTARDDPRLRGIAQGVIDNIYKQVALPNPREYGPGFFDAQGAVADGRLSTADQVLQMEKPGPNGEHPALTYKGGQELITMIKEKTTPKANLNAERAEFFKRFAGAIDPGEAGAGGGKTALGQQHLYLADQAAKALEKELIKAGKNPAEIYDPNSKSFFGTPENIAKYSVSMQKALEYEATRIMSAPPAAGTPSAPAAPAPEQPSFLHRLAGFLGAPGMAPVKAGTTPAAAAPAQPKAPLGTPGNPHDASTMTKAQIMGQFKPGESVRLPDGRIGTVPYPVVPQSR